MKAAMKLIVADARRWEKGESKVRKEKARVMGHFQSGSLRGPVRFSSWFNLSPSNRLRSSVQRCFWSGPVVPELVHINTNPKQQKSLTKPPEEMAPRHFMERHNRWNQCSELLVRALADTMRF